MSVYMRERDVVHVPPPSTPEEVDAAVQRAASALVSADALIFTAGAGMGIDSGLPDFRGTTTGLFRGTLDKLSMSYEEMSDSQHFERDAPFAWGVNYTQLEMYRSATPHEGYAVLRRWAAILGKPYFVYTSNIDGQFAKAGFPADKVVACHGDLMHLQCCDRRCADAKDGDELPVAWSAETVPSGLKA